MAVQAGGLASRIGAGTELCLSVLKALQPPVTSQRTEGRSGFQALGRDPLAVLLDLCRGALVLLWAVYPPSGCLGPPGSVFERTAGLLGHWQALSLFGRLEVKAWLSEAPAFTSALVLDTGSTTALGFSRDREL